jgi:hypothetical protein
MRRLVNLFLGLILALQLTLALLINFNTSFPLPQWVHEKIEKELAKEGLSFSARSLRVDFSARLHAEEVTVRWQETQEVVLTVQQARIAFDRLPLLTSRIFIHALTIENAALYCPAVASSTGEHQTVVENLTLGVTRVGSYWQLDHLNIRLFNLKLLIEGVWPVHFPRIGPAATDDIAPTPPAEASRSLIQTLRHISDLKTTLAPLNNPVLRLRGEIAPEGTTRIIAGFHSYSSAFTEGFASGPIRLDAVFTIKGRSVLALQPVMLHVTQPRWRDQTEAASVLTSIQWNDALPWPPQDIRFKLSAHQLRHEKIRLEALRVESRLHEHPDWSFAIAATSGNNWLQASTRMPLDEKSGVVAFEGGLHPSVLENAGLIDEGDLDDFIFHDTPYLNGTMSFAPGLAFSDVDFRIAGGAATLRGGDVEAITAHGKVNRDELEINHAVLAGSNWTVTGSYTESWAEQDYRFLLNGSIHPEVLDDWLDDWWRNLWADFKLGDKMPSTSIDIQGRWGDANLSRIFGNAELNDFSYNGAALDDLSLLIFQGADTLAIYQMELSDSVGKATGILQWFYDADDKLDQLRIKAQGNLLLDHAARLSGKDLSTVVDAFQCTSPPDLKVDVVLFDEASSLNGTKLIQVEATTSSPLKLYGVPMEHITFNARQSGPVMIIHPVIFGLAQGEAKGSAVLHDKEGQDTRIDFTAHIEDADHEAFLAILRNIGSSVQGGDTAVDKTTPTHTLPENNNEKELETKPGKLVLTASLGGYLNRFDTFQGTAEAKVTEAELGRLQLLGSFSRAMANTPFKIGSFSFTKVDASIELEESVLYFPSLTISGPTAKLSAEGNLAINSETLDFEAVFYPLGGVDTSIIGDILSLVNPISNVFRIRLHGTLAEPDWDISIDPWGIFRKGDAKAPSSAPNNENNTRSL